MALVANDARWDATRMPSLAGKIVVVTGANTGIGFEAAKAMAAQAAHVVLGCRSEARGRAAESAIREQTGSATVEFMALDVGSLASVRAFVDAFRTRFGHLDILVNNAGVMHPPAPKTADGFEAHFGVNHLGHFFLTALLFDSLRAAPGEARVVCVSSTNHRYVSVKTDFGALGFDHAVGGTGLPLDAYSTSKLCNLLFTYELSRRLARLDGNNVKAVACHPGITMTNIIADAVMANRLPEWAQRAFSAAVALLPIFQSPQFGALPTLFAATEPSVASGEFIGPDGWRAFWGYPTRDTSSPLSHSLDAAAALWARSEELLQIRFDVQ